MKSKISHEFDEDAIMLISRKIAQVAGDFRKCFSVCVKAKEHADKKSHAKVLVEDVEESLNQLLQKDKILVSSLSVKSKLILKHILKLSNNPQKETGIQEIYDEQKKYCAAKNEPAPNFDHILKMVNSLTSNNLIIQITPNGIHSKFKPNFHADSLD
uniref:Origin recognition complex subunit 1 (Trinotate prediction) n=1 Tax=Henneguya salminicola TaxID=69463 RepID=A0A6G3MF31_HENSL